MNCLNNDGWNNSPNTLRKSHECIMCEDNIKPSKARHSYGDMLPLPSQRPKTPSPCKSPKEGRRSSGGVEAFCGLKKIRCSACIWEGNVNELNMHFKTKHNPGYKVGDKLTIIYKYNPNPSNIKHMLFYVFGHLFVLDIIRNVPDFYRAYTVGMIPLKRASCNYFCSISCTQGNIQFSRSINIPIYEGKVLNKNKFNFTIPNENGFKYGDDITLLIQIKEVKQKNSD